MQKASSIASGSSPWCRRRGSILLYVIVMMTALLGICTLAVDYGHVQLVKSEMQRTADATARLPLVLQLQQQGIRQQPWSPALLNGAESD